MNSFDQSALEILASPSGSRLEWTESDNGEISLVGGVGELFPVHKGIPDLRPGENPEDLALFGQAYDHLRDRDGWKPCPPEHLPTLPDRPLEGYPSIYWRTRRETWFAFIQALQQLHLTPDSGWAVDLGAGLGWSAWRLADLGWRCVAIDTNVSIRHGLGVLREAPSPSGGLAIPVIGDLDTPPLREDSVALIVVNAALHFSQDKEKLITRLKKSVKSQGILAILDTPTYRNREQARKMQEQMAKRYKNSGLTVEHAERFGFAIRSELVDIFRRTGWRVQVVPVRRSILWTWRRLKGAVRGRETVQFPLLLARKD